MRAYSILFACVLLHAQPRVRLEFTVASVKPAAPPTDMQHGPIYGGPGTSNPGRIEYTNLPLKYLVELAYTAHRYQLSGPSWTDDARFDIVAKVPIGATKADLLPMLQSLLEDRFQLKLRHETREAQAYLLTVGKSGSKMTEYPMQLPEGFIEGTVPKFKGIDRDGFFIAPPGYVIGMMGSMGSRDGMTRVLSVRLPISNLCNTLSGKLLRPIVDRTGLKGRYDFHLMFATEGDPAVDSNGATPQASDPAPTIVNAVEKQLGLKLEPKRLPVDFLVIDHAEKIPSEN